MKVAVNKCLFLISLFSVGLVQAGTTAETEVAIFAGGCFWCVESDFDKIEGVVETVSGYTGGTTTDVNYKKITAGGTGHREAVKITFDPKKISYKKMLHTFWRTVNPTDAGGQFCDRGESYTTAIFTTNPNQHLQAAQSKNELNASNLLSKKIVTPILKASAFYPAEQYHQDYYQKNPIRYKYYRYSCGRDDEVKKVWNMKMR
jgi:peptide-methionine (S)-S-oxide reductase